nr:hypothetical protein [Tanacetum cinerariifolium]
MAQQQIIPADQLVTTKYQGIGRCNNYVVLQNIPCPNECKIVGQLFVDHSLSYALTATADIPVVYLQQFWKTVRLVVNANETIRFTMDKKEITYTLHTFRSTLKLPVKTPENPFIAPVTLKFIQPFLKITTGNVTFKGMLIPDEFLTDAIHATPKYKEYARVFVEVDVLMIQLQPVEYTQGMNRTPIPTAIVDDVVQKKKRKQGAKETSSPRKSLKVTIKQKKPNEETYASEFADSLFFNEDDFDTSLEPGSHKENPKTVYDAVEEKTDDKKDDDNDNDDDDDNDDHTNHTLDKTQVTGSLETRKEKMQTPILSPHRSPRTDLSLDKTLSQELMAILTVTKTIEMSTEAVPRLVNLAIKRDREIALTNVPELISQEFATHAPIIIGELFKSHMLNIVLNLFPTTSSPTATTSTADLQHQLYLTMKTNLQDKAVEDDLEEKMNHWVRKEFKTFNKKAQLSIQHWKDSWHKRMYKLNQRKVRDNLIEYFSNHKIVKVVRVTTEQQRRLDYMEQIIVMRETDKLDSFSEADFKCLNKNDIEDMYYIFLNKKVNFRENKLLNSLMTFIRSYVIWERVYDFQLGIESYHIRINLTAPTLILPGMEAYDSYSIVNKPDTGLIFLNNKNKKRVMYLVEIVKFCDATLERILKEVKLKIFKTEFWKKDSLLGELDLDIMKAFEKEITKHLRHHEQMRRWKSFMNERPILSAMKRQ